MELVQDYKKAAKYVLIANGGKEFPYCMICIRNKKSAGTLQGRRSSYDRMDWLTASR